MVGAGATNPCAVRGITRKATKLPRVQQRVDRNEHTTRGHCRKKGDDRFEAFIQINRNRVTRVQSETQQPAGGRLDGFDELGIIQANPLEAQGRAVGIALRRVQR